MNLKELFSKPIDQDINVGINESYRITHISMINLMMPLCSLTIVGPINEELKVRADLAKGIFLDAVPFELNHKTFLERRKFFDSITESFYNV